MVCQIFSPCNPCDTGRLYVHRLDKRAWISSRHRYICILSIISAFYSHISRFCLIVVVWSEETRCSGKFGSQCRMDCMGMAFGLVTVQQGVQTDCPGVFWPFPWGQWWFLLRVLRFFPTKTAGLLTFYRTD